MRIFARDERGQSAVLIAVSLPVVLALLLLVIDGGRLYVDRERIRNAAQLAAEAAVSLAADQPGRSQPKDAEIRGVVAEALSRNLPGETYSYDVAIPFRPELTTFNVKVSVTKPFRSSIGAVRFTIGADGAAKLGEATAAGSPPPPTPTPGSTPTPSSTPLPTPTPTPTPVPEVAVCIDTFSAGWYGSSIQSVVNYLIRRPLGPTELIRISFAGQTWLHPQSQLIQSWYASSVPKYAGWWGNGRLIRHLPGTQTATVAVPGRGGSTFTFDLRVGQRLNCQDGPWR